MGKNKGKGGSKRRVGARSAATVRDRELLFKEDGQEYARVESVLGNCRVMCYCFFDGIKRLSHIRGKMSKRVWILAGDVVLLGLREFQPGKADVIHKYTTDEAKLLKAYGELPADAHLSGETVDDDTVEFVHAANDSMSVRQYVAVGESSSSSSDVDGGAADVAGPSTSVRRQPELVRGRVTQVRETEQNSEHYHSLPPTFSESD
jgi:translation initiation factor 1A